MSIGVWWTSIRLSTAVQSSLTAGLVIFQWTVQLESPTSMHWKVTGKFQQLQSKKNAILNRSSPTESCWKGGGSVKTPNSTSQLHQTQPSHKLIRCAYQFPVNIHVKKEHQVFLPLHIALEKGGNLVNLKCCMRLRWCIVVIVKVLSSQCHSVRVKGTVAAPPK